MEEKTICFIQATLMCQEKAVRGGLSSPLVINNSHSTLQVNIRGRSTWCGKQAHIHKIVQRDKCIGEDHFRTPLPSETSQHLPEDHPLSTSKKT